MTLSAQSAVRPSRRWSNHRSSADVRLLASMGLELPRKPAPHVDVPSSKAHDLYRLTDPGCSASSGHALLDKQLKSDPTLMSHMHADQEAAYEGELARHLRSTRDSLAERPYNRRPMPKQYGSTLHAFQGEDPSFRAH